MKKFLRKIFPTRHELRMHRAELLLSLLSGIFGGLIFHHNALGVLAWIALVPLIVALHGLRGKMLAWATMLFGFIWYYLGLFWLHTLIVFHFLIPLGVFVGSVYVGAYFLLFAFPAAWCCRNLRPGIAPWAIATCWTAIEYLRNFTDMAFPWNLMGHSQAPFNQFAMNLAAYGGVSLISWLIVLFNAGIAVVIVQRMRSGKLHTSPAVVPAIVIAIVIAAFGTRPTPTGDNQPLKVSVVQPGISQLRKIEAMANLDDYYAMDIEMQQTAGLLIREAARQDNPDFIALPESTFLTSYFPFETELHDQLSSMSQQTGAHLFFGADNRIDRAIYNDLRAQGQRFLGPDENPTTTALAAMPVIIDDNGTTVADMQVMAQMAATVAAWHVSPRHGLEPRVYNKMQLVPFGEMVPFISGFTWLRDRLEASGIAGAFDPGMQNTIFEIDDSRFGAVICFESTFSYLTRHLANAGTRFICVLTNDSWYDPQYAMDRGGLWGTLFRVPGIHQLAAAGPVQHLIHSRFRAIETGLPVVRSANTGISALIDKNGKIIESLPYRESGFLHGEISLEVAPRQTLASRMGEWVGLLCTGLWLAICVRMIALHIMSRRRRKTENPLP